MLLSKGIIFFAKEIYLLKKNCKQLHFSTKNLPSTKAKITKKQ